MNHKALIDEMDRRCDAIIRAVRRGSLTPNNASKFVGRRGCRMLTKTQTEATVFNQDNYAVFTVTTADIDRDGDVVLPLGIQTRNYARNPVWFFGHQSHPHPIGRCVGPDRRLAWWASDEIAKAGCLFDAADPDAMFVCDKVKRGFLNATSIAFVPIKARRRDGASKAHQHHGDGPVVGGWLFEAVDLTEISIVGVPSNAGAIRDSLDREKAFISPALQKALAPYAAAAKGRSFSGWRPQWEGRHTKTATPATAPAGGIDRYTYERVRQVLDHVERAAILNEVATKLDRMLASLDQIPEAQPLGAG